MFSCSLLQAQEPVSTEATIDCAEVLNKAEAEFTAGHFYGIPSLLNDCLNKLTNEQKVRAYLILAQAYLLIDDPIGAENSYLKLLEANPEYVADEIKDAIDVFYLSKKFTATPIFTPHGGLGGTMSITRIIHEITTNPYGQMRKNRSGFGWHLGGGMDWNINDNISLTGEIQFAHKVFKTTVEIKDDPVLETATEKQNWIDVPLYIKYRASAGQIRPFVYGGFAFNLLINSKVALATTNKYPTLGSNSQKVTEGPDLDITYKRNFLNRSLVFGGGVLYKIGKDYLYADVRYMPGLTNVTKDETLYYEKGGYEDVNSSTRYQWVGDYYRLDNIALSVGYVYPLYYPRKVKRARTGSAFRKISKQSDETN
jgi:hypothetical protein